MSATTLGAAVLTLAPSQASQADNANADQYRSQYHFTVPDNWMNDPQRPVYINGKYNFYYLYDGDNNGAPGATAWRHATTTDNVVFHDEGVAIPKTLGAGTPMTGSVEVDTNNTAGLGAGTVLALVTNDQQGPTSQFMYYSTDGGTTFKLYDTKPVIPNPGITDFRDPKVVWDGAHNQWVAVITEGAKIGFYVSTNHISWRRVSEFDPPNPTFVECPDLFQIRADDGTMQWVLGASANQGTGPRTYAYWTGSFDGTTFNTADSTPQYLDWGSDWYAAVTWPDQSATNQDRRFAMGWVNWWDWAQDTPTLAADGFNGTDSVVREIQLKHQAGSAYSLVSRPVSTLNNIATRVNSLGDVTVNNAVQELPYHGTSYRLDTDVTWSSLNNVGISVRRSPDGTRKINIGHYGNYVYIDRNATELGGEYHAPYSATATAMHLTVLVDTSSVEVFLDNGSQVMTSKTNLKPTDAGLALFTDGGAATFHNLTITEYANVMGLSQLGQAYQDFDSGQSFNSGSSNWSTSGTAFGSVPASGALPNQQTVSGYLGSGYANSYHGGDSTVGSLTSPTFTVGSPYVNFLIGGGNHPIPSELYEGFEGTTWGPGWTATGSFSGQGPSPSSLPNQVGAQVLDTFVNGGDPATGVIRSPDFTISRDYIDFRVAGGNHPWPASGNTSVQLVINGDVYRSATGNNSDSLSSVAWDVHSLLGRTAHLEVVDNNSTTTWGHLMVDQVMFGDTPTAAVGEPNTPTAVNLKVGGKIVRTVTGGNDERLHWVSWDVTDYSGQSAQIEIVDQNTGSWGHVNADNFAFSNRRTG